MQSSSLQLPRFGDGIGLARTARLGALLDIDIAALGARSIAIAGSNGKGSVARMLAAGLRASGRRTAMFTSPHLFAFNERYEIDGRALDDAAILAAEQRVDEAIRQYREETDGEAVGAFEASFLTACLLFARNDLDDLVFEVGIGGRYDPVRLLKAPLSALVSVDLEHTGLLGNSLQEIALDKLDICPPGGRIIAGPSLALLRPALETAAVRKDIVIEWSAERIAVASFADAWDTARFELDFAGHGLAIRTALHGRHQADNAALALALLHQRLKGEAPDRVAEAFAQAMAGLSNPGRMEVFDREPSLLLDAAHTPAAMSAVLGDIDALLAGAPALALVAVSQDKDYRSLLRALAGRFDHFILAPAHRSLTPEEAAAILLEANPAAEIEIAANAAEALVRGDAMARRTGIRHIAGLGGLFWAGALRAELTGQGAASLAFD
ncbi:cyanophycin synthetase [Maricaulis sp.]|uniref:glutamate ligase domain-containing protein n=1 Tax=Maricaulis sp. TaxID=1486257 RepID=UPI002610374B|nr:cyanophycin synthetase [Maricaulis sp.]